MSQVILKNSSGLSRSIAGFTQKIRDKYLPVLEEGQKPEIIDEEERLYALEVVNELLDLNFDPRLQALLTLNVEIMYLVASVFYLGMKHQAAITRNNYTINLISETHESNDSQAYSDIDPNDSGIHPGT